MMDQTDFNMLSDVAKWREYRDETDRLARLRSGADFMRGIIFELLETRRLHEDGCDVGKGPDRHCDCGLSALAYASGWNSAREEKAP